jgi:hypothetical protein
MSTEVDELIDHYMRQLGPEVRAVYHGDAMYHAQVKWMRNLLRSMEIAMEGEGVDYPTRLRVLRATLYQSLPDAGEALERMRADRLAAEQLGAQMARRTRIHMLPDGTIIP